jgi:hypothetical protein
MMMLDFFVRWYRAQEIAHTHPLSLSLHSASRKLSLSLTHTHTHTHTITHTHTHWNTRFQPSGRESKTCQSLLMHLVEIRWLAVIFLQPISNQPDVSPTPSHPPSLFLPTRTIAKNTSCIRYTRFYLGVNSDNGISLIVVSFALDRYQTGTKKKVKFLYPQKCH